MPFVRSYFRRSPGTAIDQTQVSPGALGYSVQVFYPDGTPAIHAFYDDNLASVECTSVIPGGYGQATVRIRNCDWRILPTRAGLRFSIWHYGTLVFYGWLEDITVHADGGYSLLAMGGYSHLQQRLVSGTYNGVESAAVLLDVLRVHCPELSPDGRYIIPTGVEVSVSWSNRKASEVVETIRRLGNSAGEMLLMGVFGPSFSIPDLGYTANLLRDGELEQGTTYWEFDLNDYQTSIYRSPTHAVRYDSGEIGEVRYKGRVSVSANLPYAVRYWSYFSAHSGMKVYSRVDWFNAANQIISSSYSTQRISTGTAGWVEVVNLFTSPNGAVEARPFVYAEVGSGTGRYVVLDDIAFYTAPTTYGVDYRPLLHLWPLKPGFDYLISSAPVDIEYTTRELANYVIASYGSNVISPIEDLNSQALYRRREILLKSDVNNASAAQAMATAHLKRYAIPLQEMETIRLSGVQVYDAFGKPALPTQIHAGDRLLVMSQRTCCEVLATEVRIQNENVSIRPSTLRTTGEILAGIMM